MFRHEIPDYHSYLPHRCKVIRTHEIILGEEELSDVSLSTFYVFDKESAKPQVGQQSLGAVAGAAAAAAAVVASAPPGDVAATASGL